MQLPTIDANICRAWTQLDIDTYNKLPFYFARANAKFRKYWSTWPKLLNSIPWTPNMGEIMKRVMTENSPVLRQQAFPAKLRETPKVDIPLVRERTSTAFVTWQQFVTPHFNFLPSFQDFLNDKVKKHRENVDRQVTIFEEQVYRTHIWHWSPFVYICGHGLVDTSAMAGEYSEAGGTGKTLAWLESIWPNITGHLTFQELFKALSVATDEIGMTPFEGSEQPGGDSGPLSEKYCLVTDATTWNQFTDDPWLKENRPLNMNIVSDAYKGEFFGRIRTKLEKYGLRLLSTQSGVQTAITYPAPEDVELNPNNTQFGRTIPNLDYARNAQVRVSFLVGGSSYSKINVGAPPGDFSAALDGHAMNWNGETFMTKNFLIPCKDPDGNTFWDTNSWGHFVRAQAEATYGIVGDNRFNVLPVLHLKRTGSISTVQ